MYFVAGQNSSNSYAKNAGEVVAGSRVSYAQQTWSNTIPSPGHKVPPSFATAGQPMGHQTTTSQLFGL